MTRLLALSILLTACASPPQSDAPQLGERVLAHPSYAAHCVNYPDSIFCINVDDD